tara:strand:+ start:359 stop:745 length:387 start_codon:yes stop_codon:yes gene_type:complete
MLQEKDADPHGVLRVSAYEEDSELNKSGGVDDGEKKEEKSELNASKEADIYDFLREEVDKEDSDSLRKSSAGSKAVAEGEDESSKEEEGEELTPYTTNVAYLSDIIEWLTAKIRFRNFTREKDDGMDR